jgi:hypothetical protein
MISILPSLTDLKLRLMHSFNVNSVRHLQPPRKAASAGRLRRPRIGRSIKALLRIPSSPCIGFPDPGSKPRLPPNVRLDSPNLAASISKNILQAVDALRRSHLLSIDSLMTILTGLPLSWMRFSAVPHVRSCGGCSCTPRTRGIPLSTVLVRRSRDCARTRGHHSNRSPFQTVAIRLASPFQLGFRQADVTIDGSPFQVTPNPAFSPQWSPFQGAVS